MADHTPNPATDGLREGLTALVAEHRPNVVNEEIGVLGGEPGERTWRTRVKCDGDDCGFYAEGPRYWDVVRQHNAHLTDVLVSFLAAPLADPAPEAASVEDLIERSSLGTPEARALRATVSDEDAARIVARSKNVAS